MSMAMADTTREAKTAKLPLNESIKLADLTYPMVRPLSLVTSRRLIGHDFQTSSYSIGSTATCYINSGDDYVYGPGCNLRFDVTIVGGTDTSVNFGIHGSAVNLIKNIEIYHSSGIQIDRTPNVSTYNSVKRRLNNSTDHYLKTGTVFGTALETAESYLIGTGGTGKGATHSFSVPMSELHGLWGRDKLIPAQLHSGLKVVVQLGTLAEAFVLGAGTALTAITLSNMRIEVDSLTLTDSASLFLQTESAKNGLVFPFTSFETISVTGTTNITTNVLRAVSQATMAYAIGRVTANLVNGGVDSFLPIAITTAPTSNVASAPFSVQWKIAGQYFPVKDLSNYRDLFQWNLGQISNVPNRQLSYSALYADVLYSGIQCVRLERDHALKQQGIPVSGSRALTYTSTWGVGTAKTVDVFMEFVKLARVYMFDKVIVQE